MHFPGVPRHTFRLPKPKSRHPYLHNDRSITRERALKMKGIYFVDPDVRECSEVVIRSVTSLSPIGTTKVSAKPEIASEKISKSVWLYSGSHETTRWFSYRVHRVLCAFHVMHGRVCLMLFAFSLCILASPNK